MVFICFIWLIYVDIIWFIFPYIGNVIIPTGELTPWFFRGVETTNQGCNGTHNIFQSMDDFRGHDSRVVMMWLMFVETPNISQHLSTSLNISQHLPTMTWMNWLISDEIIASVCGSQDVKLHSCRWLESWLYLSINSTEFIGKIPILCRYLEGLAISSLKVLDESFLHRNIGSCATEKLCCFLWRWTTLSKSS